MNDTPRTKAVKQSISKSGVDWHHSATLMANHAEDMERALASLKCEKEKLHVRCLNAEELFLEVTRRRPHEMYWVYRALAAEAKLSKLEVMLNRMLHPAETESAASPTQGSHAG